MSSSMNDWPVVNLGMFADFRNGLNFSKEGRADPVYIVGVGDFQNKSSLEGVSSLSQIRPDGPLADDDLIRDGDFLFVRSNGNKALIGRCVYITGLNGNRVTFSGFTIRARLRNSELHPGFAKHALRSDLFKAHLHELGGGSNISNLNQDILGSFELRLPSLPEQRRIAAILDEWDVAIATSEKLTGAKNRRMLAFTEKLLFNAASETQIGSIASQTTLTAGKDFKFFQVLSCTKHDGLVLSDSYFGKQVYGNDRRAYKVVAAGEFAYATNHLEEGSIGQNTTGIAGIVSPMYTTFRAEGINASYLRFILKAERLRKEFERRTPASVNRRGGLRWSDFAEIQIPYHLDNEQAAIANTLSHLESDLANQAGLTTNWHLQKRGIMQKLLSGNWPVPASIDRLLPGELCIDQAVGAEAKRAKAT